MGRTYYIILSIILILQAIPLSYYTYKLFHNSYNNGFWNFIVLVTQDFVFLGLLVLLIYVSTQPQKATVPNISNREKKYCGYCGTENEKDANFCQKCGKKISET